MERVSSREQLAIGGDLVVNRLGFGAMHLTGPGMWGEPLDPHNAIAVLRRAVDLGVNFIDTADSYGPATNERIIRRALHPYPDDLVISTKGGLLRRGPDDWDRRTPLYIVPLGRPEYLRQQVEMSLRNLDIDCIDLYQLHAIDPAVPFDDQIGELSNLRSEGKIRHIGLSGQPGVTFDDLDRAKNIVPISAVESLYNVSDRSEDRMLERAGRDGLAFISWFPLGHGDLVAADGPLAGIASEYGVSAAQLALGWLLRRSPMTLLIPGTSNIAHLEENMGAAKLDFSAAEMSAITDLVDSVAIPHFRPGSSN